MTVKPFMDHHPTLIYYSVGYVTKLDATISLLKGVVPGKSPPYSRQLHVQHIVLLGY